jgi:hypothetical protein
VKVGYAETSIDADLNRLLRSQKGVRVEQILRDRRHVGLPGPARKSVAAGEFGVPRVELECVGRAEMAVGQPQIVGGDEIGVPQLDCADMDVAAAAKQHHHRREEIAGKNRQRDTAGQTRGLCRSAAFEMRVPEIGHEDRVTGSPRPAGKPLIETEAYPQAGRSKFVERPINPAAELELHAILGRNPNLRNPNEGPHHGLQSVGMCPDRTSVLSILAHAAPTLLANSHCNDTT